MSVESNCEPRQPLRLPVNRPYSMAATLANGWSDQYGAFHLAADYCGASLEARYAVTGIWHHGCHGPWVDYSPGLLCHNAPDAKALPVLVARKDQAQLLQSSGYVHARAIGLPIAYVETPACSRLPRSLLVVPTHTLVGDQFPDRTAFERYAEEIAAIAPDFNRVVVCIHPSCVRNGFWISEFTSRGFEIVYGAQSNDLNALARMRMLFEQFESVTTNGWGSHVAYALAFGAKASICGTQPVRNETDLLRDTTWAADRQAARIAQSAEIQGRRQEFLKELLVAPGMGVSDIEFGRWLIGADLKLPASELREVLKQIVSPAPVCAADRRQVARDARQEIFSQTRVLVQTGKKREAVQTLLRAAGADIATKDPHTIHAGLSQIADELAALEPALAGKLRAEAEKIAVAHDLQPAWRVAI